MRRFISALQAGAITELLELSTPEVQNKLNNYIALTYPGRSEKDARKEHAAFLRSQFQHVQFEVLELETPSDDTLSNNRATLLLIRRYPGGGLIEYEVEMIRDADGNWKNNQTI